VNLGQYLIEKLQDYGANHVFGIPGDYSLNFIKEVNNHPTMQYVGVCREDSAGYAADAYGRMNGCGVACITYSVGAMNTMNATAGAYAEKSPMVIISGMPTKKDLQSTKYKHHTILNEDTQREIFDKITVYSTTLDWPDMLFNLILLHHALEEMREQSRPIYLEFSNEDIMREVTPKDLTNLTKYITEEVEFSNLSSVGKFIQRQEQDLLENSMKKFIESFKDFDDKVLVVGHEIFRNCLEHELASLIDHLNIPVFTTILGKSTFDEYSDQSLGCISQLCSHPLVTSKIKDSSCIISLGLIESDLESFSFESDLSINMDDGLIIKNGDTHKETHFSYNVRLLIKLMEDNFSVQSKVNLNSWYDIVGRDYNGIWKLPVRDPYREELTLEHVFDKVTSSVDNRHIILSDIGESLFGMIDKPMRQGRFLSLAYYTSMSFSIPGALGVKFAKPGIRPVILVGDGAFQMSGSEFSSHVFHNINSIVIILNNQGYSTERAIMEGTFNDINNWNYEHITMLVNGGNSEYVITPDRFDFVLDEAIADESNSYVFNLKLNKDDMSPTMKKMISMCK
jgi:indolepyruvate decarboxylase